MVRTFNIHCLSIFQEYHVSSLTIVTMLYNRSWMSLINTSKVNVTIFWEDCLVNIYFTHKGSSQVNIMSRGGKKTLFKFYGPLFLRIYISQDTEVDSAFKVPPKWLENCGFPSSVLMIESGLCFRSDSYLYILFVHPTRKLAFVYLMEWQSYFRNRGRKNI